jgi:hypothetical protein
MKRRTALILVFLAGGALGQPQPTKAVGNNQQKSRPPTLLWQTFPLHQQTLPLRQQTAPDGESQSRVPLQDRHARHRNWLWIVAGTTLALSATVAAVAGLLSHSLNQGGHMDKFRLGRAGDRKAKGTQQRHHPPAEPEDGAGARNVRNYLSAAPDSHLGFGSSVEAGEESDFGRLGEHVSSVLSAAKEAAARIHEEARQEAERVHEQAQTEATARAEAARENADATRAEAERLRAEVEEWTTQARTAADAYAADRRSEAEAEARKIASAAERQAASFAKEAERRQQALKIDISLAEDRLRQLATGLHDLAGRLDKLLSTPFEGQEDEHAAGEDDSLIDALAPSRETEEATR